MGGIAPKADKAELAVWQKGGATKKCWNICNHGIICDARNR